jgi:hypothetical protein
MSLIFGYLGDRLKVWALLCLNTGLVIISGFAFIYCIKTNSLCLQISFVGLCIFYTTIFMLVRS